MFQGIVLRRQDCDFLVERLILLIMLLLLGCYGVFEVLLRIFFDLVKLGLHLTECGLERVSIVQLDLADEANDAIVALIALSSGLELAPLADHLR